MNNKIKKIVTVMAVMVAFCVLADEGNYTTGMNHLGMDTSTCKNAGDACRWFTYTEYLCKQDTYAACTPYDTLRQYHDGNCVDAGGGAWLCQ